MSEKTKMTLNFVSNKSKIAIVDDRRQSDKGVYHPEQYVDTVTYYPKKRKIITNGEEQSN